MRTNIATNAYEKLDYSEIKNEIELISSFEDDIGFNELRIAVKKGLNGSLVKAFYILKADCGLGKSKRVQEEINIWKSNGFPGSGTLLIALKTHKEIDDYISGSGLVASDYAVISSDPRYNGYGLGRNNAGFAKVLFTTHEQFDRRVRENDSFEKTILFHYMGGPRSMLIWDEGLHLIPPLSISYDTLGALPDAIGYQSIDLKERLYRLIPDRGDLLDGDSMLVPDDAKAVTDQLLRAFPNMAADKRRALEDMGKLAGCRAYYKRYNEGWALVGTGRPLPADMPPTIVLDASGRLTDRYDAWARQGLPVVQFTPVTSSYANLTIRWIDRPTNKMDMRDNDKRAETYRIAANIMNAKAEEPWLIVIAKEFADKQRVGRPPAELAAMLNNAVDCTVVTWGLHVGSNDYRHFRNVIIIGAFDYPGHSYDAIHVAKGNTLDMGNSYNADAKGMEFMHNIFQAVCRSNVRNHVNGACGEAEAHFIMAKKGNRIAFTEKAFPDADVVLTVADGIRPKNNPERIIAVLPHIFRKQTMASYDDIREHAGVFDNKDFPGRFLKSTQVTSWLAANYIRKKGTKLVRSQLMP